MSHKPALTLVTAGRIVGSGGPPCVTVIDVGKLALIAATPTLLGVLVVCAPRWWAYLERVREERAAREPAPLGPPIQQLAADLRRLLRLHRQLTASAHLAMRAHRLWAVEAAIAVRATEAANALDVPHREPEQLSRTDLAELLHALAAAGLVLPTNVGPFVGGGGRF
jgi:hypothetical protein